jgi:alcohol dehydrogenase class IV
MLNRFDATLRGGNFVRQAFYEANKGSNFFSPHKVVLGQDTVKKVGLAYVIDTEYHLPHGRANAIMLPHVMDFNKTGKLAKFAKIAEAMGEKVEGLSVYEAAGKSVEAVKNLLDAVQVPFRLFQYGIPRDDLPKLVEGGMKQARLFIPNPRDVPQEDLRSIYEKAF